ncbi:MAG: glycoside hydrolase family 97 catalytic domain-containing protein [Kiritimatiellae bacterium]|nr:glycoside hydrolase family 97 catalytic domain-containing protein [Kiritimatiellia bacterium]
MKNRMLMWVAAAVCVMMQTVAGATYQFNTAEAPELASWVDGKLKPLVETWYPKLCELLASRDFQAPQEVRFRFLPNEKMRGTPAWTAGTEISLNHEWFARNLEGEALGCVVHEMVHVVQAYRGGRGRLRTPGWVQEGLADYVRWFLYEPEKHAARANFRDPRTRYDNSYRVSANFIDWVERRHGDPARPIYRRLNAVARAGRYTDDFWEKAAGKDLAALDAEWKSSSRPVFAVSPDRQNAIVLSLSRRGVELAVKRHQETQVTAIFSCMAFREMNDAPDGRTCVIAKVDRRRLSGKVPSPVYKRSEVDLAANETTVRFADGWGIVLQARNDAVAYRLFLEKDGRRQIRVEDTHIVYPSTETRCWAGANNGSWHGDRYQNSWESVFKPTTLGELATINQKLYYLPFVTEHKGVFTAFTESDLRDYPGADLVHFDSEPNAVRIWRSQVPAEQQVEDPHVRVTKREPYFAETSVSRALPWQVFLLGDNPADLAAADAVWALAAPADKDADFSWVKPGLAAWEWWSSCGLTNVPFRPGSNTDTYLHFIDFAAEYGLPYYLIDAGWSKGYDILTISPSVDIKKVMAHAAAKKVGLILWVGWSQLKGKVEERVAYLAGLGAKGLKIDFMDRDDQDAVRSIEEIAAACAKHHLVIDWHGMFKPTGLERKYPNILNYEGIFGLEIHRWDPFDEMPRHDCQAVFTRMLAGPMDYTPGGMRNLTRAAYAPSRARGTVPTQGTRVHQMALFTLFFAPLQMMADSASAYRANPECARFIASVPTVWDETVALPSTMGETAVLARRKGKTWYLAAIGDWTPRTLSLATKFLGSGSWNAEAFEDAPDADKEPTHWTRRTFTVKAGEPISAKLAPGGGFTVRLTSAE